MDKDTIATYPGRPAEQDLNPIRQDSLEREEHRLNASRERIRQRLTQPQSEESQRADANYSSEDSSHNTINSWSSLLMNLLAPSVKNTAARHPYTLLIGSALIGGYFAWSRPWRKLIGSVLVGTVVRNLVAASVTAGSRNGGRILRNYLNRRPQKKYSPYHKQDHTPVSNG